MSDAHGRPNRIVVLVVEDEPLVRALAVDVLEEAGFEVIEASNSGRCRAYCA